MAEIRVPCAGCGAVLKLSDAMADVRVRCPNCKTAVVIPSAQAAEPISSGDIPTVELVEPRGPRRPSGRPARKADERPRQTGSVVGFVVAAAALALLCGGVFVGAVVVIGSPSQAPGPVAADGGDGVGPAADPAGQPNEGRPKANPAGLPPRDEAEDRRLAAERDRKIQALRATELRIVERLARNSTREPQDLEVARFGVDREGAGFGFGYKPVFSSDGQLLAAVDFNKLMLWRLDGAELLCEFTGPVNLIQAFAFAPQGDVLLAAADGKVWFWEVNTGKLRKTVTVGFADHAAVAFSPNGSRLVASFDGRPAHLRVWDLARGAEVSRIGQFEFRPSRVAFRPDGKVLATVMGTRREECTVQLWDAASGKAYRSFAGGGRHLCFSPDGRTLAASPTDPADHVVRLYDLATGAVKRLTLPHHPTWIAFSPDGKWLLTEALLSGVQVWDVKGGKERSRPGHCSGEMTFSPGGVYVVGGFGKVWLADDLLDGKLSANLDEAKKAAKVTRSGLGFHVALNEGSTVETLRRLRGLVPFGHVSLEGVKGEVGPWLAELKAMKDLRGLSFRRWDRVTDADFARLAGFEKLEALDLDGAGPISDDGLAHLAGMTEMKRLALGGTKVTGAGLARLGHMKKLSVLELDRCPIHDEGLKRLAGFTQMTELSLANAEVSDAGLIHLAGLTRLTKLDLQSNKGVSKAGLSHLRGMKALRELNLSWGGLEDEGLAHLKGLTSLTRLDLTATKVTDEGLSAVAGLTKLETLHLPEGVTDAGLAHVRDLTDLKELRWGNAKGIRGPGLAHLAGLKKIKSWGLAETGVTDAGLAHLKGWTHVTSLTLPPQIGGDGLAHLAPLVNLESLYLDGTKVTDAGLVHLVRLASLWLVSLRETRVTDGGLAHLGKVAKLRSLDLRNTGVSDAGLRHLEKAAGLTYLFVQETRVTEKGAAALKKALPEVIVIRD
jgi:hypothetical protein